MINSILGTKIGMSQRFTKEGKRIPVTKIKANPCRVTTIKTIEKDGYCAVQLGFGEKKMSKIPKAQQGYLKKAGFKAAFLCLKELKVDPEEVKKLKIGAEIKASDIFKPGDKIKITGSSKGKGFAGVVKRWGFKGGPKTHGQSDRQRSPGSIGQTTTPGRVYRGKRMAGRMGGEQVTISGLKVVGLEEKENLLLVGGPVPGPTGGLLFIQKDA